MKKPKPVSRAQATHDIINTIDHWHAARTANGEGDGLGEDASHGYDAASDNGFNAHVATMLQHVPWHAYKGATLRAILLLILDGMPVEFLERMHKCGVAELAMIVSEMDADLAAKRGAA